MLFLFSVSFAGSVFASNVGPALATPTTSLSVALRSSKGCENPAGFLIQHIVGGKTLGSQNPISNRMVYIEFTAADGHTATCTGSILPRNIILTAAHCMGPIPNTARVAFTTNEACMETENLRVVRPVIMAKINPRYFEPGLGPYEGDMALLKYEGNLPKGYTSFPVPGEPIEVQANESLFMVGYGRTNATISDAGTLRITSQKISRLKNSDIHDAMIMVDQHDQGICMGDSGGPLLIYQNFQYKIVAVAASVYHDSTDFAKTCNEEAGFVGTEANVQWIQKTYQEMTQP